jgi:single-strand DNA-binding protein
MQSFVMTARLTQDPELKTTKNDIPVAVLRVANNDNPDKPLFLDVEVYGKGAEPAAKYLAKGRKVLVIGRLVIDEWETADGQKRSRPKVVGRVEFLDRPGAEQSGEPDADIPS